MFSPGYWRRRACAPTMARLYHTYPRICKITDRFIVQLQGCMRIYLSGCDKWYILVYWEHVHVSSLMLSFADGDLSARRVWIANGGGPEVTVFWRHVLHLYLPASREKFLCKGSIIKSFWVYIILIALCCLSRKMPICLVWTCPGDVHGWLWQQSHKHWS